MPFLESVQFQPSFGELGVCAKLLSVLGAWCLNLVNTTAETGLLCVFMDKRHCNCISSRQANELFNHLHMDMLSSLDGGAVVVVSAGVLTVPYSAPLHI